MGDSTSEVVLGENEVAVGEDVSGKNMGVYLYLVVSGWMRSGCRHVVVYSAGASPGGPGVGSVDSESLAVSRESSDCQRVAKAVSR